ncbi:hypothetical protein [Desulfofarcimen acetoxidans]|jgi:putative transposase|nr:hypothetical protein [Desulfofarcimen acetoxidans]
MTPESISWLHATVEKPALGKIQGSDVTAVIDPGEVHATAITEGKKSTAV